MSQLLTIYTNPRLQAISYAIMLARLAWQPRQLRRREDYNARVQLLAVRSCRARHSNETCALRLPGSRHPSPIGRERMLHAIGRAVARTQIQAEWGLRCLQGGPKVRIRFSPAMSPLPTCCCAPSSRPPMAQVVFAVSTLVEAPLIGRSSPDGAAPVPA